MNRITLSQKILLVFLLLTLATLGLGATTLTSVARLRQLNERTSHIKGLQVALNRLESLQAELSPATVEKLQSEIDSRFAAVHSISATIEAEDLDHDAVFHEQLSKIMRLTENYRKTLHELAASFEADRLFAEELPDRQYDLYTSLIFLPTRERELDAMVLDFLALQDQAFHLRSPVRLGAMRRVLDKVKDAGVHQDLLVPMRELLARSEANFITHLAILDQRNFLKDTAENCFQFTEKAISNFTAQTGAAQQRMVLLAGFFVSASVVLTVLLWWVSNRYMGRFLDGQHRAIEAIEAGRFDYQPEVGSNDELGDLARFTARMARQLGHSIQQVTGSEEKYRALVETTDTGFVILDCQGTVRDANDIYLRLTGRTDIEEVIGRNVREWTVAGDREATDHALALCTDRGGVRNLVVEYGAARGQGTPVEVNATLVGSEEGPLIMALCRDISDRRRAEEALAAEKERLAVTLRSIGDGVITTDTAGRVVLLNKVAEELTGWRQEEASGRPLPEVFRIVNEKTGASCENPVEKVLASGQIVGLANHTALIARDGRQRSIADSGAPIRDQQSRIIGVVLVFRDVTGQHQMEQELQKGKRLESVGLLAGGIAHDFNNILTAVLGNISIAGLTLESDPPRTKKILQEAEKAALRARDLTQQLLTFSKGGAPLRRCTDLAAIIRDSAGFVLSGSNCSLQLDCPADLWPADVDPGQISQVIHNLVLNARHAMPEGGSVAITCRNVAAGDPRLPPSLNGDHLLLEISDSGSGIPEEIIEHIFDPYFTTKKQGSGLGLAVSHSIVRKHGGHIGVTSSPGRGATFTIFLPVASTRTLPQQQRTDTAGIPTGSGRVLILDDEEMIRRLASGMLQQLGYEPVCTADGQETLTLFRRARQAGRPFAAVILDLTIPGGMGGRETARQILAEHPEARLIVSSGYSNDPILADFRAHGFCEAVAKPYRTRDLAEALHRALLDAEGEGRDKQPKEQIRGGGG